MSDPNNTDVPRSQDVFLRMNEKTTEELLSIWQENNISRWSQEEFNAVQEILKERVGDLPEQKPPVSDNQHKDSLVTSSPRVKHLYLLAYMDFVILIFLLVVVSSFIPKIGLFVLIVGGFFIFRYVIEKSVLPYVNRK